MKYCSFSLSVLASMAAADMDSILKQMAQMTTANNVSLAGLASLRSSDNDRFVDPILTYMTPILDYGCWCHFGTEWIHAGGKVRDEIDQRCKQLIQGYRCARMDARAINSDCDAGSVQYTPYNFFFGQDLHLDCQASNAGNQCAIDVCVVEGSFTLHFLADFVSGDIATMANPAFQASNGWDRATECAVAQQNPPNADHECCGIHPNRAPYSPSRGNLACCSETAGLYQVHSHDCCTNAVSGVQYVDVLGSCP